MAALTVVIGIAGMVAGLRWLRVAQREHYHPGTVSRFAFRWWIRTGAANLALFAVGLGAGLAGLVVPLAALGAAVVAVIGPLGLGLRGRTSPLVWTRRMRVLAAVAVVLFGAVVTLAALVGAGPAVAGILALRIDVVVDVALWVTRPFEKRAAARFVRRAAERLDQVGPLRVAITGSYGKTTTKGYVRHLIEGDLDVVASPASFNNTAGLSRTVNEMLAPGTEVFVAEMGTYGAGEIASLCSWVKPSVAVICAIGPVHLERMGTLGAIVKAKSEILGEADVAVLNVDAFGLAEVADRVEGEGKRVIRTSGGGLSHADVPDADVPDADVPDVDVLVRRTAPGALKVTVDGHVIATAEVDAAPSNVACAVGTALAVGVPVDHIAARLGTLPVAEHRRQVVTAPSGVVVIDDTYNANPEGAATALDTLSGLGCGRRVVVTPGMVELGRLQDRENKLLGATASRVADDVLIVGLTNRSALSQGAAEGRATVHQVATRDEAVAWVREHLGPGDAVLYENDLPDHYP